MSQQYLREMQEVQDKSIAHITTVVRLRPLLSIERDCIEMISAGPQSVILKLATEVRTQKVESVFSSDKTQRQLYQGIQPLILRVAEGYNVTVLAYGQTGSGKTHTMFGRDWSDVLNKSTPHQSTFLTNLDQDQNHAGLIPRAMHSLFLRMPHSPKSTIKIYCSFLQLYNQHLVDLLAEADKVTKLTIHENAEDGVYVEGLTEVEVRTLDECLSLMQRGESRRTVRQTTMNDRSSRSHTLFQFLLEEIYAGSRQYRRMKLNLCDLAGSQRLQTYQTIDKQHFSQLKNINLSLTSLGKVIAALSSKEVAVYRNSKLTRLLSDSLGGNAYTAIIATLSTKASCLEESLNTLQFLQRARQIKREVVAHTHSMGDPKLKELQQEIAYLRDVLKIKKTGDVYDKMRNLQRENIQLKALVQRNLHTTNRTGDQNIDIPHSTIDYRRRDLQETSKSNQHCRDQDQESSVISKGKYLTDVSCNKLSRFNINSQKSVSRNTNASLKLPSINNKIGSSNKIMERINQIDKLKKQNKTKLEIDLMKLNQQIEVKIKRIKYEKTTQYQKYPPYLLKKVPLK